MHIHGCHVVPFLDADGEEGFSATIKKQLDGETPIPVEQQKTSGKINSIRLAIQYAKDWTDPANPPALPKPWVDPGKVTVETKQVESENFTLQIDNPVSENEPPKE